MAEPGRVYDKNDEQPVIRPDLRALENDNNPQGQVPSVSNLGPKSKTPEQLQAAEASSGKDSASTTETEQTGGTQSNKGSLFGYREEGGRSKLLFGIGGGGGSKGKSGTGSRKKLLLGAGALGGVGIFVVLIGILFLIGSLLIPDFATHMTEYEFSRVVRTLSRNNLEITAEKDAIDSIDTNTTAGQAALKNISDKYSSVRDSTWGKLDNYRPQKVIDNLGANGELQFNYKSGVLGRQTLSGVTFDGVEHPINSGAFFNTFHPIQSFNQDAVFASNFGTALDASLREQGIGVLIRGAVENQLRKEIDISLVAWAIGRYQGKTPEQADIQATQDVYAASDNQTNIGKNADSNLNKAEEDGAAAETKCVQDASCIGKTIANGQIEPATAVAAVTKDLGNNLATTVAGAINPIITIGFPVCMINAGSLHNSGPTIDTQNAELQRSYYYVASAADQQKAGKTTGEAVGAVNWKLGNVALSDAEIRAGGGTVNTSGDLSPQASAAGQYTDNTGILSVIAGGAIGSLLTQACGYLTSPTGIISSTLLSLFVGAGGDGVLVGIKPIVDEVVSNLATQFTTKQGLKEFAGDVFKNTVIIVGGTLLAKLIVANHMGAVHNGLATGTNFDNDVEAGANLNANQVMQREFFGVPMNDSDTAQSDQANQAYVAELNSTRSVGQRYFALSNPDSLFSRMAIDLSGAVYGKSALSSLPSLLSKLFNPFSMIPKIFGSISTKTTFAATSQNNSANQHYGIVQWGWTPVEEQLIQTSSDKVSYQPLENALVFKNEAADYYRATEVLDKNGNVITPGCDLQSDIENPSGSTGDHCSGLGAMKCFKLTMGVLLTGSDNGGNPEIIRDNTGNVDESHGLCSESQLGPSNNYGGESQSVFRWRLMQSYNATLDNLTQVQNFGSSSS